MHVLISHSYTVVVAIQEATEEAVLRKRDIMLSLYY